jgi:hypothetical protein
MAAILLLIYGGLKVAEKGLNELTIPEPPAKTLALYRNTADEIVLIFAGRAVPLNFPQIRSRLTEIMDRLPGNR